MPDGTTNVPVEQVIALVARDPSELALLQSQTSAPVPPPINTLPTPPSISANPTSNSLSSPRLLDQFKLPPLASPRTPTMSPRTPSLFEMHSMGHGHRSLHVGRPRGQALKLEALSNATAAHKGPETPSVSSPRTPFGLATQQQEASTPMPPTPTTALWPISGGFQTLSNHSNRPNEQDRAQMDGAAIRRMIVSNLSSKQPCKSTELDELI